MIWGAFALLAAWLVASFLWLANRVGIWQVEGHRNINAALIGMRTDERLAFDKYIEKTIKGEEQIMAIRRETDELIARARHETKPEPLPPLPACLCGSVDLLLMNGYLRTRIVACQRCGKVFGVDGAGVRFDRHAEAWPEFMSQARMRELAAAEMKRTMERAKSPEKRIGREMLERPGA